MVMAGLHFVAGPSHIVATRIFLGSVFRRPAQAPHQYGATTLATRSADLMRRGQEFIVAGDLASARLVLQRAAEAGDSQAALMLAGTYNPIVLEKVGVQGFRSEARKTSADLTTIVGGLMRDCAVGSIAWGQRQRGPHDARIAGSDCHDIRQEPT
jgi:hypothetical protein